MIVSNMEHFYTCHNLFYEFWAGQTFTQESFYTIFWFQVSLSATSRAQHIFMIVAGKCVRCCTFFHPFLMDTSE